MTTASPVGDMTGLAGFVARAVEALGEWGVGLFTLAETVFPPIPSEVILPLAGFLGQVMRDTLAAAHRSPFSLSARARGESETGVLLRHSLRHAALPGIALSGWAFGSLLSGAVVVESIFARPGLGRSLLSAVTARDIPMVTGVALLSAAAYVVIMAFSDLAERLADPRMAAS